jgi:hypothetical protein
MTGTRSLAWRTPSTTYRSGSWGGAIVGEMADEGLPGATDLSAVHAVKARTAKKVTKVF